jgi:hypothetical protein
MVAHISTQAKRVVYSSASNKLKKLRKKKHRKQKSELSFACFKLFFQQFNVNCLEDSPAFTIDSTHKMASLPLA